MDKFFGYLAVDTALDQLTLYLMPPEFGVELRILVWVAAMTVQWACLRRWVLTWAALEPETEAAPG